jgi:hypothetical protein
MGNPECSPVYASICPDFYLIFDHDPTHLRDSFIQSLFSFVKPKAIRPHYGPWMDDTVFPHLCTRHDDCMGIHNGAFPEFYLSPNIGKRKYPHSRGKPSPLSHIGKSPYICFDGHLCGRMDKSLRLTSKRG